MRIREKGWPGILEGWAEFIRLSVRAVLLSFKPPWSVRHAFGATLILYLLGISAFSKSFARLHVTLAGIPLFVGEAFIAVLLGLLLFSVLRNRRLPFHLDGVSVALLVYLAIGSVFAFRGLLAGEGLAALRDFALVYYLLFFFFGAAFIRISGHAASLIQAMVGGAGLGSIVAVGRFVVTPATYWGHAVAGYFALLSWIAVLYVILFRQSATRLAYRFLFFAVLIAGSLTVFLSAYRVLLAPILASLAVLWTAAVIRSRRDMPWARSAATLATMVVVVIAVSVGAVARSADGSAEKLRGYVSMPIQDAVQLLSARWVRGVRSTVLIVVSSVSGGAEGAERVKTAESVEAPAPEPTESVAPADSTRARELDRTRDPDASEAPEVVAAEPTVPGLTFRLEAWRNALQRIGSSPLFGIGYGPAPALYACGATYSPTSNCGNAHNTYLTLAMRMGIPVFLFFLGINLYVLIQFLRTLSSGALGLKDTRLGLLVLMSYLSFMTYAFMSLFFESPYLSSLYWVVLAVMHHLGSQQEGSITEAAR